VNGLLDTKRATMTGMTRDGLFLVEDGKVGRPVRNLRWTESLLDAFSRVGGVGRELRAVAQHWTGGHGGCLCPHILLRDFHFTGRSR
jgi:predicted Zn-dependent protease